MNVGPGSTVAASLRKNHNKVSIARLKKIGPVRIEQLATAAELEAVIATIAEYCDVRQGGAYGSLPFTGDQAKRRLYLRMMDSPMLLHATVLWAGKVLLAAHLGLRDRGMVSLGVIVHAPQYAQHSPGKLMILLLGRLLGEQGDEWLDLTPGGSYKDNFAKSFDNVAVLQVFLRPADYVRHLIRRTLVAFARMVAGWIHVDARSIGEHGKRFERATSRGHWIQKARVGFRRLSLWLNSKREFRYYWWDARKVAALPQSPRVRANVIGDLLLYQPISGSDPPLTEFLSIALSRLARGEIPFSAVENGRLVHYSWLIPNAHAVGSDYGHELPLSAGFAVLYGDYTHPGSRNRGLHQESIMVRLQHVAMHQTGSSSVIGVQAENGPPRHNIEKMGFEYCGSAWIRLRLGTVRRWAHVAKLPFDVPSEAQASLVARK
jgi:hypothetical protein